jgi:hypothetical protein
VVPRQADFSRFMLSIKCLLSHGVQLEPEPSDRNFRTLFGNHK